MTDQASPNLEHRWRVVPISDAQRLDVRPDDLIEDGLYRRCLTYRGGGGYDRFPDEFEKRYGSRPCKQFIVQLFGCNLDCPYCYVTRSGVWGDFKSVSTAALVLSYRWARKTHGVDVFHLMGGAPALQLKFWPELIDRLEGQPFHSDLMLTEGLYDYNVLTEISQPQCLYAVNIKGVDKDQHRANTRKELDVDLVWENAKRIDAAGVPFYLTFTATEGRHEEFLDQFYYRFGWVPSYHVIDLIDYKALPFVDSVKWGTR